MNPNPLPARRLPAPGDDKFEDPTMARINDQVRDHTYRIDSRQVAEEILRKRSIVKRARARIMDPPGPSRAPKLRGL